METGGVKIERRSLADQVYDSIRASILSGKLVGGQRISEEAVAEEFGVSRTPIREALRRLEEYGLVQIKPRSFAQVVSISGEEADQIIAVRAQLECLSVSVLSGRVKAGDIETLRGLARDCREILAGAKTGAIFAADSRFHLALAQLGGNGPLHELMERFDAKVQMVRLLRCAGSDKIAQSLDLHDDIISAIEVADAVEAKRLMLKHIHGIDGMES